MIAKWLSDNLPQQVEQLMKETEKTRGTVSGFNMKQRVAKLIRLLQATLYPNIYYEGEYKQEFLPTVVAECWQQSAVLLYDVAKNALGSTCEYAAQMKKDQARCGDVAEWIVKEFMTSLPDIAEVLNTDITAAFDGDPAARSKEEVMLAYPAFEAITVYRLAHRLFELKLPLIPRMMTEYAHQKTAIDIHPGAVIGRYFFIDHGSGVVIGETCHIGSHVKLYQGVTLGAKSFELDEAGHPVKGGKRHPDVGDHVVIYAGATVLGGNTVIGSNSVIGGSVWLTHSVPEGSTIYYNPSGNTSKE